VTQTVFTDLARKAASLPPGVVLGGWLHRHTCFTAANAVRTEQRRRARERTAMEMNAINDNSGQDAHWTQLAPVLDDALNCLNDADRDAIVLRYFEHRDLRAIGAALGLSDDTAQKRISRALEKLRAILTRRGVTLSTALLFTTLDTRAASPPVSADLAASISANALSGTAAVGTSFIFATLHSMITNKFALALAAVAAVTGVTLVVVAYNYSVALADSSAAPASAMATAPTAQGANPRMKTPTIAANSSPDSPNASGTSSSIPTGDTSDTNDASGGFSISGTATTTVIVNGVVVQTKTQPMSDFAVASHVASALLTSWTPTGDPLSTTVNADGSTTSTYGGENGETIEVTISADGKSRNMVTVSADGKSRSTKSLSLSVGPASSN
jgi:RNA polymerase sigma factor (sigma-70 family)